MTKTFVFDTHRVVKRFIEAGFTEKQAEVIAEEQKELVENNLATKRDIDDVKKEIELLGKDLTIKIYLAIFGALGLFITIMKLIG